MIVVISSCSAKKDDSCPIPENSKVIPPQYYLDDLNLIQQLENTRDTIFKDPRSKVGTKVTYAFDLYVRVGNAYRDLSKENYEELKKKMASNELEWFFISGGYGIIHALEPARKYQATFSRSIANKNMIPFTANYWKGVLSEIVDSVISKFDPEYVYVFGSQDYTAFVKDSKVWSLSNSVRLFESTGSSGPFWLSPIIGELAGAIIKGQLSEFNKKYPRFMKQKLEQS